MTEGAAAASARSGLVMDHAGDRRNGQMHVVLRHVVRAGNTGLVATDVGAGIDTAVTIGTNKCRGAAGPVTGIAGDVAGVGAGTVTRCC